MVPRATVNVNNYDFGPWMGGDVLTNGHSKFDTNAETAEEWKQRSNSSGHLEEVR
jgi:hypothetical protein